MARSSSRRFTHGARLPLQAARFILAQRSLWPYVAGPIAVTLLLVVIALAWVLTYGHVVTAMFLPDAANGPMGQLHWIADMVIRGLTLVLMVVAAWFVGSLLSAPFHDRISDRTEHLLRGEPADTPAGAGVVGDVLIGLSHSLGALLLYLGLSCALLPINVLPGLGSVGYAAASVWMTGLFLVREVLDYSTSRRRLSFLTKLSLIRDNLAVCSGLGVAIAAMVAVPFTTFFSMPVAVVAGTMLWCELEAEGLTPR